MASPLNAYQHEIFTIVGGLWCPASAIGASQGSLR